MGRSSKAWSVGTIPRTAVPNCFVSWSRARADTTWLYRRGSLHYVGVTSSCCPCSSWSPTCTIIIPRVVSGIVASRPGLGGFSDGITLQRKNPPRRCDWNERNRRCSPLPTSEIGETSISLITPLNEAWYHNLSTYICHKVIEKKARSVFQDAVGVSLAPETNDGARTHLKGGYFKLCRGTSRHSK